MTLSRGRTVSATDNELAVRATGLYLPHHIRERHRLASYAPRQPANARVGTRSNAASLVGHLCGANTGITANHGMRATTAHGRIFYAR
jgi:hypothetical protein